MGTEVGADVRFGSDFLLLIHGSMHRVVAADIHRDDPLILDQQVDGDAVGDLQGLPQIQDPLQPGASSPPASSDSA